MAIFRAFWAAEELPNPGDKFALAARTIDIEKIESWEFVDEGFTRVFMDSGDTFIVKSSQSNFSTIVYSYTDGYGVLFNFNKN